MRIPEQHVDIGHDGFLLRSFQFICECSFPIGYDVYLLPIQMTSYDSIPIKEIISHSPKLMFLIFQ
jgi:hypothetical protein